MKASTATAVKSAAAPSAHSGKYLSFQLGKEEYAIQVIRVREIVKLQHITCVPETPREVRGVINLRGRIIPVVDLRLKFGMDGKDDDHRTCIVVVEPKGSELGSVGIIVDEVNEVLTLGENDVQDTPEFAGGVTTRYLLGLAKIQGEVKILLDIDEVLAAADLTSLRGVLK